MSEKFEHTLRVVQDYVEEMCDEDITEGEALDGIIDTLSENSESSICKMLLSSVSTFDGDSMTDYDCAIFVEDVLEVCFREKSMELLFKMEDKYNEK